jgi:replicative DNA helicase
MSATARRDEIQRHIVGPVAPSAVEAEKILLGIVLSAPTCLDSLDALTSEHFYEPLHGRLWGAVLAHHARGAFPDPALLDSEFLRDEAYRGAGGIVWLAQLAETAPGPARAPAHAAAIREMAQRRRLHALGERAIQQVKEGETPAADMVASIRREAEAIEQDASSADASMIDAPAAAAQAIAVMQEHAQHGRPRGLMTGLRCVDRRLNGLLPGAMLVIGGRPGMGKTALLRAILHGAAVRNPNKLFVSLGIEMGPEEMMQRELSALTQEHGQGVEYRSMASAALTPFDFQMIGDASARVPPNLILDDCPRLSVDDVRRKLWTVGRRGPVGAWGVDYLQLMQKPPAKGRNDTLVIGEMTQTLKLTARQTKSTGIVLSQLSRHVEQREDKKPQPSDLRDSGTIEQDADVILFPFRPFYYTQKAEPSRSDAGKHRDWEMRCEDERRRLDVFCAKQRGGPEGCDRQRYFAEYDFIEDEQ